MFMVIWKLQTWENGSWGLEEEEIMFLLRGFKAVALSFQSCSFEEEVKHSKVSKLRLKNWSCSARALIWQWLVRHVPVLGHGEKKKGINRESLELEEEDIQDFKEKKKIEKRMTLWRRRRFVQERSSTSNSSNNFILSWISYVEFNCYDVFLSNYVLNS